MSFKDAITRVENPAKKFLTFNGDKGCFQYYDKVKETKVDVSVPFKFVVLHKLSCVTGWNEASESSIWSNEVTNLQKQDLIIKTHKGNVLARGKWGEIKDKVKSAGGKFTMSLYVYDENGEIVNIKLSGAACKTWMDSKLQETKGVELSGSEDRKKGKVDYKVPVFESFDIESALRSECITADEIVEKYVKDHVKRSSNVDIFGDEVDEDNEDSVSPEIDAEYEAKAKEAEEFFKNKESKKTKKESVLEEVEAPENESNIKPEDVPF